MYVYHYSDVTGEYLGRDKADADPAETKLKGEFDGSKRVKKLMPMKRIQYYI